MAQLNMHWDSREQTSTEYREIKKGTRWLEGTDSRRKIHVQDTGGSLSEVSKFYFILQTNDLQTLLIMHPDICKNIQIYSLRLSVCLSLSLYIHRYIHIIYKLHICTTP